MTKIATNSEVRVIGAGRFLTLVDEGGWEYVRRPGVSGIVVIVAFTEAGKLVLVEQPRVPVHQRTIELPAGLVGDDTVKRGESAADAGHRELIEETGYQAAELVALAEGPPAVGLSDESVTFFHARGLRRVGPGGGDGSENITVHEVALAELPAFLAAQQRRGLAIDPKIYSGLYLVGARAP